VQSLLLRITSASSTKPVCADRDTRQPTMRMQRVRRI
jgi:hypothetical protein